MRNSTHKKRLPFQVIWLWFALLETRHGGWPCQRGWPPWPLPTQKPFYIWPTCGSFNIFADSFGVIFPKDIGPQKGNSRLLLPPLPQLDGRTWLPQFFMVNFDMWWEKAYFECLHQLRKWTRLDVVFRLWLRFSKLVWLEKLTLGEC